MYLHFYNLKRGPFHITPDPEFLFLSPSHKEALASIIYGIKKRKGFVLIIGEVGVGKTTILRSYLEWVNQQQLKIIYIFNSNVSFKSLLKTIYQELGLATKTDDVFEMVKHLYRVLIEEYKQGNNVVLVIDEAQNMPIKTLENLRMLSNLETSKDKLIQIVLIGQPEFEQILNLNELRQLKQRIAIRSTISSFTEEESIAYIQYRLAKVSMNHPIPVFTQGALQRIVKQADGIPRIINILCDNSLITGFGYQRRPVDSRIVREVIADFEENGKSSFLQWIFVPLDVFDIIYEKIGVECRHFGKMIGRLIKIRQEGLTEK
jgi:general secretion pathway protein A